MRKYLFVHDGHRSFISAEYYHHEKDFTVSALYLGRSYRYVTSADVHREHNAAGISFGITNSMGKHFFIDLHAGLVVDFFKATASNIVYLPPSGYTISSPFPEIKNGYVGQYVLPVPTMGIKFGYMIGRR